MPVWQVGSDQLPGAHLETPSPPQKDGGVGNEVKIGSWVKIKRERSLTVSVTDKTVLTLEKLSLCVFPGVPQPWMKGSRKKGKEKYLSVTESKALLPEFVLYKRLSPCSQRGGHHLETCPFVTLLSMKF